MKPSVLPTLLVLAACSSGSDVTGSVAEATSTVTFHETQTYVDWVNQSGTFRIYKVCLGPESNEPGYIGHDGTVGPGYVATAWTRDGRVVVDDTVVPAHLGLNSGATGLGQFGFHLARGYAPHFAAQAGNVFQVTTRFCNANRRPTDYGGYAGFGVRSFSKQGGTGYAAPSVDGSGLGHFTIETVLGDAYSDLVSVRYTYVVGPRYVKAWIRVTTRCDRGTCDAQAAGGNAFVKEPKVVVGVDPASPDDVGYRRMTTFDPGGTVAESSSDNRWKGSCGASAGYPAADPRCEWGGADPTRKTGQCDDPARTRVRFWNGESCPDDTACLVVASGSATTEGAAAQPWEGAGLGLDAWAMRNVAEGRETANTVDTAGGGAQWSCNGSSAARANRRWELAGYPMTGACSYATAAAFFHGWEGGTGMFDCENLYYRFGPAGESYVAAVAFGFDKVEAP